MNKLVTFVLIFFGSLIHSQNNITHEVYFETDKYEVIPTEENRLLQFISGLADIDIESIAIFGFCDDVGADSYNLKLSKQRAEAIKAILSNHEISENVITNVDGKGEVLLRIVNETNVSKIRGLNRKVEIIINPKPPILPKKEEEKQKVPVDEKPLETAEVIKGELKVGDKIRFENILFKTGYSLINPESKKTLNDIAEALVERDNIYFTIEGHVCCTQFSRDAIDRKTKERNLSVARAKYVYDYFIKKGVSKKRMRYLGMRRKFPLGGDPKYDRRVEIVINYIDDKNKKSVESE
ncbi:OmpA family protein [Aestuariibaculum suncheonense]|uniref:OmpA family protein n=1 Tax=Aestuariibaculum suncheonense TaxID=1028745 RepID=A0A8J6UBZ2_9FLAO|nr:OmpA family protein [Aestuariibaculum suncheonense]MBD0836728.1 OmpA family protein [Aestuariibaculum suncheonense]